MDKPTSKFQFAGIPPRNSKRNPNLSGFAKDQPQLRSVSPTKLRTSPTIASYRPSVPAVQKSGGSLLNADFKLVEHSPDLIPENIQHLTKTQPKDAGTDVKKSPAKSPAATLDSNFSVENRTETLLQKQRSPISKFANPPRSPSQSAVNSDGLHKESGDPNYSVSSAVQASQDSGDPFAGISVNNYTNSSGVEETEPEQSLVQSHNPTTDNANWGDDSLDWNVGSFNGNEGNNVSFGEEVNAAERLQDTLSHVQDHLRLPPDESNPHLDSQFGYQMQESLETAEIQNDSYPNEIAGTETALVNEDYSSFGQNHEYNTNEENYSTENHLQNNFQYQEIDHNHTEQTNYTSTEDQFYANQNYESQQVESSHSHGYNSYENAPMQPQEYYENYQQIHETAYENQYSHFDQGYEHGYNSLLQQNHANPEQDHQLQPQNDGSHVESSHEPQIYTSELNNIDDQYQNQQNYVAEPLPPQGSKSADHEVNNLRFLDDTQNYPPASQYQSTEPQIPYEKDSTNASQLPPELGNNMEYGESYPEIPVQSHYPAGDPDQEYDYSAANLLETTNAVYSEQTWENASYPNQHEYQPYDTDVMGQYYDYGANNHEQMNNSMQFETVENTVYSGANGEQNFDGKADYQGSLNLLSQADTLANLTQLNEASTFQSSEYKFCFSCSISYEVKMKFCGECGAKLELQQISNYDSQTLSQENVNEFSEANGIDPASVLPESPFKPDPIPTNDQFSMNDPLQRSRGCPIVTFGFNGKLYFTAPIKQTLYQTGENGTHSSTVKSFPGSLKSFQISDLIERSVLDECKNLLSAGPFFGESKPKTTKLTASLENIATEYEKLGDIYMNTFLKGVRIFTSPRLDYLT
jgi:hypothetical protein